MAQVIHLTHDAGDWSEYDVAPVANRVIDIGAAAGLNSSAEGIIYDSSKAVDTAEVDIGTGISDATEIIRLGWYMDLNTLDVSGGDAIIFDQMNTIGRSLYSDIRITEIAGNTVLQVINNNDVFSQELNSTTLPSSGEFTVEVVWEKPTSSSSNDGVCTIYINGGQVAQDTTLDNETPFDDTAATAAALVVGGSPGSTGIMYYDEIIVRDDSTPIYPAVTEFRFLGFSADTATLMVSGLKDAATLKLYDYDLASLTEAGTAEFGSATDTELDNRTRGIFPASKPMEDDVWYVYGRDGNNLQVQYNDRNGTLGWVDLGPGTATWGTDKYAVALMPSPTRSDDVIVAFSDADIYRTRFGTMTWVLMGTANTGLRAVTRHIANRFNELLTGGTAAGTLEYSNNFGASWGDVSGTALGTVNALEVSL